MVLKAPLMLAILLMSSTAAAEPPTLSVLDLSRFDTSETDAHRITDSLTAGINATGEYRVIDRLERDRILDELGESLKDCAIGSFSIWGPEDVWTDEACQIEAGRLLSADRLVLGSVQSTGYRYSKLLTLKLLDVQTGITLTTATGVFRDIDELKEGIPGILSRLLSKGRASGSSASGTEAYREPGTLAWFYGTGGDTFGPSLGTDGTIYLGSGNNRIYAINPNGTLKWFYSCGGACTTPAVGPDGIIFVASYDGYLHAVNPDGKLEWSCSVGNRACAPVVGADGTVYVGSMDAKLYAVSRKGTLKWVCKTTDEIVCGTPVIAADGSIYVTSQRGTIYAISPDGDLQWSKTGFSTSPAIGPDGTIYAGMYGHRLCALDDQGRHNWCFTEENLTSTPAISADGTIYAGSYGNLFAIIPKVGLRRPRLKWSCVIDNRVYSTPAISTEGTIYVVGTDYGNLYAIDREGHTKWVHPIGYGCASNPVIGPDGTIYLATANGMLYAIAGDSGRP